MTVFPFIIVAGMAAGVSLLLTIVNKRLVPKELSEAQEQASAFHGKLREAVQSGDQERIARMHEEMKVVVKAQRFGIKRQLIIMLLMIGSFFCISNVIAWLGWGAFVRLPFNLPVLGIGESLTWVGWYVLCALTFGSVLSKIFK